MQASVIASGLCLLLSCATACTETQPSRAAASDTAEPVSPPETEIPPQSQAYATAQDYQCVAGKYLTSGFSSTKDYYTVNADWLVYVALAYPGHEARGQRCFAATPKAAAVNLLSRVGYTRVNWAD